MTVDGTEAGENPWSEPAQSLDLVEIRCALCGSDDVEAEAAGYDYEYNTAANPFHFVRCRACGHVYLHPRPAVDDLDVIYPDTYYTLSPPTGLVGRMQRVWEKGKVERWAEFIGQGKRRVMDVGCGDGRVLEVLRDFGPEEWELVGLDFDTDAVEKCKARGFEAHARRVEDFTEANGTFDGIIMLQLIEHVDDPAKVAERVFDLLKPGGAFIIETPNLGGLDYRLFKRRWWGHYHFPRHWNLFSTPSLHRMLVDKGFEIATTEYLISTSSWTVSFHNYFFDRRYPDWFVRFFHYKNPLLLGAFVSLDTARKTLGMQTSNQRVIACKPE